MRSTPENKNLTPSKFEIFLQNILKRNWFKANPNTALLIAIGSVVIFLVLVLYMFTQTDFGFDFGTNKTSEIGDTIGGITAPFVGSFAAFLIYLAFREQVKTNREQNLRISAQEQNRIIEKEREKFHFYYSQLELIYAGYFEGKIDEVNPGDQTVEGYKKVFNRSMQRGLMDNKGKYQVLDRVRFALRLLTKLNRLSLKFEDKLEDEFFLYRIKHNALFTESLNRSMIWWEVFDKVNLEDYLLSDERLKQGGREFIDHDANVRRLISVTSEIKEYLIFLNGFKEL